MSRSAVGGAGSSPRSRGTPKDRGGASCTCRLIPAFAGNTEALFATPSMPTAHPRVRGEHHAGGGRGGALAGSSPRSRGTRPLGHLHQHRWRLIPAFAGNTTICPPETFPTPAHPRVRGEHASLQQLCSPLIGSSPRSRGTLLDGLEGRGKMRLIPAFAGNTSGTQRPGDRRPAHPRVRREHTLASCQSFPPGGSSPRSREHHELEARHSGAHGSSPRSRGTLRRQPHRQGRRRLIPAFAGNTFRVGAVP